MNKVVIKEIYGSNRSGYAIYELVIKEEGGKSIIYVNAYPLCESPEDACLERDLDYVYKIVEAFKLGYDAGKKNQTIEYIREEAVDENI